MIRKYQRRIGLIAVWALMMASLMAACSSSNDPASNGASDGSSGGAGSANGSSGGSTNGAEAPPAGEEETKEFAEVSWYMLKPVDNLKDQAMVEDEVNNIFKEELNANLRLNFIDSASWEDRMKLMSGAGEAYDLVMTAYWTNRLDHNVQAGSFLPLDDLLQKYGQDILAKVDPRAWKAVTYDGKIMAIPAQMPYAAPYVYVFKKDLVEKHNFDYRSVRNLKDLEPYLETIKQSEPGVTPLLAVGSSPVIVGMYTTDVIEITKGVYYDEKSGQIVKLTELTEVNENMRTVNDFYKKGYIAKDAAIKTDLSAESKSGQYAVLNGAGGFTEDGSKSTAAYGYPTVETLYGNRLIDTNQMITLATAISKTSRNPERAMMLLNLIWKDAYVSNTLAYGLKDKHYTVVSGEGTDQPSVVANSGAEQTYAVFHNWIGPLWDQWDSNWNTREELAEMQANNETSQASSILGFLFNPTDEIRSELAQVGAIVAEANPVLNTGSMPDFDKYMNELDGKLANAGIDKIVAEVQKQLEAWRTESQ